LKRHFINTVSNHKKRPLKNNLVNKEIAKILRKKGNIECTQKSETLENEISEISNLNLRNLGLDVNDIVDITTIIEQENSHNNRCIKSISFSYNVGIGDIGATLIAKKIPSSVSEIGLVDCGIGDKGGAEILHWMRTSHNLQMICMEQNKFSDKLKMEFNSFKKEHPNIMVVY
jgi:hypothetical protein